MRKYLPLFLLLFAPLSKAQTTYTAASCGFTDVQAKINQEQATPVDGDIIAIPAGSCTWTAQQKFTYSFPNSLTIQGAGAISSTANGAGTTGTDQTTIIDNVDYSSGPPTMMGFSIASGKSFRFTGIAVLTNGSSQSTNNGTIALFGSSTAVRVDHCHFQTGSTILAINGSLQGVADHDYFTAGLNSLNTPVFFQNGQGWNSVSDPNGLGDSSWADGDNWGSSKFFFVEDTLFQDGDLGDSHDGARYVLRHSTFTQSAGGLHAQMYAHGLSNSPGNGTRAVEVYSNTFSIPGGIGTNHAAASVNSGNMLFWGNVVSQYTTGVGIGYTCRPNSTGCNYSYPTPPTNWGYCGTTFNGTGSNWDQNSSGATGYACLSQPGRGKGQLMNNQLFPNRLNTVTGTVAWPQQVLSPIYVFNNNYTPAPGYGFAALTGVSGNGVGSIVNANRDFYQQFGTNAQAGSNCTTSPCNITVGVNQTTRAPVNGTDTCTAGPADGVNSSSPGVGWWNTANNTLYVCNPTNTWAVYYTPFTYPHPLQGGGGGTVANPTFSPPAGSYSSAQNVTISTTTSGASLFFCTDTTGTCTPSTAYTGPVPISSTGFIGAQGTEAGFTSSAIVYAHYIFTKVATPTFNPGTSTHTFQFSTAITTTTAGATIIYTTDGTTPVTTSGTCTPVASGTSVGNGAAITINASETVLAIGCLSGDVNSSVGTAIFTQQVPVTTYAPPTGNFIGLVSATISDTNTSSTITYCIDGTNTCIPNITGAEPLSVTVPSTMPSTASGCFLRSYAFLSNWSNSSVSNILYTVGAFGPPTNLQGTPITHPFWYQFMRHGQYASMVQ